MVLAFLAPISFGDLNPEHSLAYLLTDPQMSHENCALFKALWLDEAIFPQSWQHSASPGGVGTAVSQPPFDIPTAEGIVSSSRLRTSCNPWI